MPTIHAHQCLWVFVGEVNGPDSRASSKVKHTFDFGSRLIWWSKSQPIVKSEEEELMLEIWGKDGCKRCLKQGLGVEGGGVLVAHT